MDAQEYAHLRQRREQWVADDPADIVTDFLDTTHALFTAFDRDVESSDEAMSAIHTMVPLLELLESAALRGGSLNVPDEFFQPESTMAIPELGGRNVADIIADLTDEDGRFKIRCVMAFRQLHEAWTQPESPSQS